MANLTRLIRTVSKSSGFFRSCFFLKRRRKRRKKKKIPLINKNLIKFMYFPRPYQPYRRLRHQRRRRESRRLINRLKRFLPKLYNKYFLGFLRGIDVRLRIIFLLWMFGGEWGTRCWTFVVFLFPWYFFFNYLFFTWDENFLMLIFFSIFLFSFCLYLKQYFFQYLDLYSLKLFKFYNKYLLFMVKQANLFFLDMYTIFRSNYRFAFNSFRNLLFLSNKIDNNQYIMADYMLTYYMQVLIDSYISYQDQFYVIVMNEWLNFLHPMFSKDLAEASQSISNC